MSKLRLSVMLNVVLMICLFGFVLFSQQVAAGEDTGVIGGVTVSLVVPDNYESCAPSDIVETTGVPDDWTVSGYYQFFNPVTGVSIGNPVQATSNGNFYLAVAYPSLAEWPTNANGDSVIAVGAGAIIRSPSGERGVLSLQWIVTCKSGLPTNTPAPTKTPDPTKTVEPTETPVPPTETPVPPTETPPPTGGQGCTPGYWKQEHHFDSWVNYEPTDDFETVFGVDASFDEDLLGALSQGGGGEYALGRHAVAALLNAANPDVSYLYTEADVISLVQSAYASGDFEGIKNVFEMQNDSICPLN